MDKHYRGWITRFIDLITFVNLPIRKKFILFGTGVMIWFVALFVVSVSTLVVIRHKSNNIVSDLIPWDKTIGKISRGLQDVSIDASEIGRTTSAEAVIRRAEASKARLNDVRVFLATLLAGGQVNEYSRADNAVKESYRVAPLKGDAEGEQYVRAVTALVDNADRKLDELALARIAAAGERFAGGRLDARITDLGRTLSEAVALSDAFSARIAAAYADNYQDIGFDFACTFITVIVVLLVATGLLVLFTVWISNSFARPVNYIIEQIRSLSVGDMSTLKKIEIASDDEIGVLSAEFNGLMESVSGMASFKKLIEEDDTIEDVYLRLARKFTHDLGLPEVTIYEVSNSQNKMKPVYPVGLPDATLFCNADILTNCSLCRAKKTGHEISSLVASDICKSFLSENNREYFCFPMIMGGETGGVVQFVFPREDAAAGRRDIERKVFRAKQFIVESLSVIDAKRLMNTLRDSALKDSLTGLYNRRYLQEYTESLVAGVLRREKHVGLIMCDLDYFKQVNDLYGHATGDAVLKETASIIRNSVRAADLVIRFGGEEFLVVLLDIKAEESMSISEKIRQNMAAAKLKAPDGTIKKTISLGISEFPLDTDSFWQAIKFADVALYKAKETGRNKSVRFSKDMWTEEQF